MTGLYECLVQIRALRETAQRLAKLVSAGPEGDSDPTSALVLQRRTRLELSHGRWLALLLGGDVPAPAAVDPDSADAADAGIDVFLAAREANLALLEHLGAPELERAGNLPGGRPATVTDVVAMMVAADTDAAAALLGAAPTLTSEPRGEP